MNNSVIERFSGAKQLKFMLTLGLHCHVFCHTYRKLKTIIRQRSFKGEHVAVKFVTCNCEHVTKRCEVQLIVYRIEIKLLQKRKFLIRKMNELEKKSVYIVFEWLEMGILSILF